MNNTTHLKTVYKKITKENIELLVEYLKSISGDELSVICRRQNAFKTKWINREENIRNRCHVQNAVVYLQSIKDKCSESQIKVVIADIAKYVNLLDSYEDTSFILISTNTLPSAIKFDIAERLFLTHQIRKQNQNNYGSDLLTIYALRLSLESRIKGLLGIDYATNKGQNINLSTLIEISKGLKSIKYSKDINWTEIEWINKWINHHMHRQIRPYPWIIYQAFESLKSFIDPKEPIIIENRTIYSFYSATLVENEEALHNEIKSSLKQKYSEIEIVWNEKREITK